MLTADSTGGGPDRRSFALRGTIEDRDVAQLDEVFEETVRDSSSKVVLDLSGLESWSLLAQAMTLSTARRLSQRGSQLILVAPSEELVQQSKRLDIFGRVTTRDKSTQPPSTDLSKTLRTVALLIVRNRRLLLVRKRHDATLHLPGGTLNRAETHHEALVRHLDRQLGVRLDVANIQPRMTVRSVSGRKPVQNLLHFCFEAPFAEAPSPRYEVHELVWASTTTRAPMAPATQEVRAILGRARYVD